ncbi:MAG: hypothetical protein ACYSU0_05050 [Planctomycetota bacterium]
MRRLAAAGLLLVWLVSIPARAKLRAHYEDEVIVERSEVIVVGRLKRDSIRYVPFGPKRHGACEHHAVLMVTDVLKGELDGEEVPIIYPKDAIVILDSAQRSGVALNDAQKDNLWFLRRGSGSSGTKPRTGKFGIVDPEDVQPLALRDYFLTYLSKDPEKAVRVYVAKHPELAKRTRTYFDHLEIDRILKIADQRTRVEKLLPYCAKWHWWNMRPEAMDALVASGQVDILIELLKKHDGFWAAQDLEAGRWDSPENSELTRGRREVRAEVYCAVHALRRIGEARAREAVELTKRRWEAIDFPDPQIVVACRHALTEFGKEESSE